MRPRSQSGEVGRLNRAESRYFSTAARMDEALIQCLEKKDFAYITVKEICEKAGVNRSTFYLHYETIADLLDECVAYINRKCFQRYSSELADVEKRLASGRLEDLIFISPEYLRPYFEFVRENRRLFQVALSRPASLRTESTFQRLFTDIFSPVLDRFHLAQRDRPYLILFYIGGLMAIVKEWIEQDCADPMERIIDLCVRCVMPGDQGKGP